MFDVALMKYEVLNQLSCLKEIVVLSSTELFAGSKTQRKYCQGKIREVNLMTPTLFHKVHNLYRSCNHSINTNMGYKGRKLKIKTMSDEKCCIYIPSAFYDLVLGKQKPTMTFLQGREDDMTTLTTPTSMLISSSKFQHSSCQGAPTLALGGPITCSRAMQLQQEVHVLLCEIHFNINESYILPKSCMLLLLRFTKTDDKNRPRLNQREEPRRISSVW
jgi:hypothetical protein